jgi:H+/Cl- antiporter ClcA
MQVFKNKKTDMYFCLLLVFICVLISILTFNETIINLKNGYYKNSVLNGGATFTYEQNPAGFILTVIMGFVGGLYGLYCSWLAYKDFKLRKREVDAGLD